MQQRLYAVASMLAVIASAQGKARDYWHADPCGGQVTITAQPMSQALNAFSVYTTTDGDPAGFRDCRIVFNSALTWSWEKFCTVTAHEYGHLLGIQHSPDPADVMYPYYVRPVAVCRRYQLR